MREVVTSAHCKKPFSVTGAEGGGGVAVKNHPNLRDEITGETVDEEYKKVFFQSYFLCLKSLNLKSSNFKNLPVLGQ